MHRPAACRVTLLEAQQRLGGKIRTTPFAGRPGVDEGADAFLARVPEATQLAHDVGLADQLTSPATGSAAVWWDGLKPIPPGLVLGLPTDVMRLARSRLLSWTGKLRAATEVVRPRTEHRRRLDRRVRPRPLRRPGARAPRRPAGRQHLRRRHRPLQPAGRAAAGRSGRRVRAACCWPRVIGRRRRRARCSTRRAAGMGDLVEQLAQAITDLGGDIQLGTPCQTLERDGDGWRIDGQYADGVVLACPAAQAARLLTAQRGRRSAGVDRVRRCGADHRRHRPPRLARAAARHERLPGAQAGAADGHRGVVRLAEVGALA